MSSNIEGANKQQSEAKDKVPSALPEISQKKHLPRSAIFRQLYLSSSTTTRSKKPDQHSIGHVLYMYRDMCNMYILSRPLNAKDIY